MKNFLRSYPGGADRTGKRSLYPGPVVMISRECGCSAKRIATKLSKILSGYSYQSATKTDVEWKWVSKEIIEEAARELELDQERVKEVFLSEAKTSLNEVSTAFSTEKIYDAEDLEIIDTVKDVIFRMAEEGHCIIVGRASGVIAKEIPMKLSVKLQAPLEWRINRIMQISEMSHADAREYVLEIDRQRDLFVEHMAGRKMDNNDYDLIFNYSTLQDDFIVDAIINIMKSKQMLTHGDGDY